MTLSGVPPLLAIATALLGAMAGAASAAPEDDYVALMTAVEIDNACIALKYVESSTARRLAWKFIEQSSEYLQSTDGRLPMEEYGAWKLGLDDRARDAAQAAGCTQQALSHVLAAKARASEEIYRGMLQAVHFDGLLEGDGNRIPLDQHKKQTLAGYENYLRQLYGQNFDTFVQRQRSLAAEALPLPGSVVESLLMPIESDAILAIWEAQLAARSVVNDVQFEVTAEANGYLVRPHAFANGTIVPSLRRQGLDGFLPVVKGPGYQLVNDGDRLAELYYVVVVLPDRRLGIMYFGETAMARLQDPTIRLYVREAPYPAGTDQYSVFDNPGFRDGASAFDATRVSESCLGAPCFELPIAATDALMAGPEGNVAELFVSFLPGAEPPPIGPGTFNRESLNSAALHRWLE